ncbi:MAG: dihydrofolate reductase family protein, partial [Bradymonadia bacterium]
VMVEGGGTLVSAFLNEKLADELSVFFAPKLFGAGISWAQAELARVASDAVVLSQVSTMTLGDDVYIRGALSYAEGSED